MYHHHQPQEEDHHHIQHQQQPFQPPSPQQQQQQHQHKSGHRNTSNQQHYNQQQQHQQQQQQQHQLHVTEAQQMSHNNINTYINHTGQSHAINTNQINNIAHMSLHNNRSPSATQNRVAGNNNLPYQHHQRFQGNHSPQVQQQNMMHAGGLHLNQNMSPASQAPRSMPNAGNSGGFARQNFADNDFPLRILVQSDMIGAIIGRSGSTIKQITQQSKARIDVHREESLDQQEKVITINGLPESCSTACFKILEVIQNEKLQLNRNENKEDDDSSTSANRIDEANIDDSSHNDSEIHLRILAHNNLIGRLIGRSGATIKKMMEQTSTKINIVSNSLTECTNERTISVIGNLDQVRHAEQVISAKLRATYMSDVTNALQAMNQQPYLFNNIPISYVPGPYTHNPILSSLVGSQASHAGHSRGVPQNQIPIPPLYQGSSGYLSLYSNMNIPHYGHGLLNFNSGLVGQEVETVNLYIPNSMVGAIIGKSGSAIKEMISNSGASIKVAAGSNQPKLSTSMNKVKEENSVSTIENEQDNSEKATEEQTEPQEQHQSSDPRQDSQASTNLRPNSRQLSNSDSNSAMRKVTIVGSPESQWTAQYLIYRKVSKENGKSDISLMVEIYVPAQSVGKIIGKGGAIVKQLQKQTRTTIRLSDEKSTPSENDTEPSETCVQITGEFQSSQLAQRQIRNLIRESLHTSSRQNNRSHQSRDTENNSNYSANAQADLANNYQQQSDNHSRSILEDTHEAKSNKQQDDNSVEQESPNAQDECNSASPQENLNRLTSDDTNQNSKETGSDSTAIKTKPIELSEAEPSKILSNNNTSNKNLNSSGEESSREHSEHKETDNSNTDANQIHESKKDDHDDCLNEKVTLASSSIPPSKQISVDSSKPALPNNGTSSES